MKILVNGAWHDTEAVKLAVALGELGYGDQVVATAVNGEFVGAEARAHTTLAEGDRVEVLAPMQGG
ncbi:MAG TPA: sulfur carrier protein ThiS [Steroidobacteraceae bacterium]|jgi:sulfur carrier protein|nr:sulfur carrier protein ThiS [Steroidobacteraceae bacterium]